MESLLTGQSGKNPLPFGVGAFTRLSLITGLTLLLISGTITGALSGYPAARYIDELIFFGILAAIIILILARGRLYISNIMFYLFLFTIVGLIATSINRVRFEIAIPGYLLAIKPLILFIAFQIIPINQNEVGRNVQILHRLLILVTVIAFLYMLIFEIALGNNRLPVQSHPSQSSRLMSRPTR